MNAMFELLIRVLKWLPRPLVPLVPLVIMLLGPVATLMLIVYAVDAPHGDESVGLSAKAPGASGVAISPSSGSSTQTSAISTTMSKMSSQPRN